MQKNMNVVDRTARMVAAVVVAALMLSGVLSGVLGLILGVLAVVFVVTGLSGFCPLYRLFGKAAADGKEKHI